MASREIRYRIDLVGRPQFVRLVEFVREAEDYARLTADEDLQALVDQLRDDLARMK